jgi:hypothetical protein
MLTSVDGKVINLIALWTQDAAMILSSSRRLTRQTVHELADRLKRCVREMSVRVPNRRAQKQAAASALAAAIAR